MKQTQVTEAVGCGTGQLCPPGAQAGQSYILRSPEGTGS